MILGTTMVAILICGRILNPFVLVVAVVTLALGVLGFLDDYQKVAKNNSEGVSGKLKLTWQAVVGLGAGLFLYLNPETSSFVFYSTKEGAEIAKVTDFGFPLLTFFIPFGLLAIPFFMAILMGTSNAVNLTDGLDGLAIMPAMIAAGALGVIAYAVGRVDFTTYLDVHYVPGTGEILIFCAGLIGGGMGFLWYNAPPAAVFMGDTGSLALGGALGSIAVITKHEIVWAIIGGLFVLEALSVIIQVLYFKKTGKRVFLFGDGTHVAAAARIARDEMGFEVAGLGCFNREMARPIRALAKDFGARRLAHHHRHRGIEP